MRNDDKKWIRIEGKKWLSILFYFVHGNDQMENMSRGCMSETEKINGKSEQGKAKMTRAMQVQSKKRKKIIFRRHKENDDDKCWESSRVTSEMYTANWAG